MKKKMLLFLISYIYITIGFAGGGISFDINNLNRELLGKSFQTKIPLGISYLSKDNKRYTANLSVITELHGNEIRYLAKGGLKIAKRIRWDGSTVITPKIFSDKYVSLNEIKSLPENTIVTVKKIKLKGNTLEMELKTSAAKDIKCRLIFIENVDFEGVMERIAQVLKIDYIEALKPLLYKKREAEKRLSEAVSIEDKFESLFSIKEAIERILKIEELSSIISSKYLNEKREVDSKIQELYKIIKEPVIIIESSTLEPELVKKGDLVTFEVKYRLVVPKEEQQIKIKESALLLGKDISLIIKKKESDKTQGVHLFSLQFLIPMGLQGGEYTLTAEIEAKGKKKMVGKKFNLVTEQVKDKKIETQSKKSVVAGVFFFKEGKPYIQPLVEWKDGKFYSIFSYFNEARMPKGKMEEIRRIKKLLKDIKIYWLYDKGKLVGRFNTTKITSGMLYADSIGDHIVVAGNVSWGKNLKPKMGGTYEILKTGILALSQPIPQRSFFLSEKILTKEQRRGLDELPFSIIKNIKGNCPLTVIQRYLAKPAKKRFMEVLDINNDGYPEVYLRAKWEMSYFINTCILASWKGHKWEVIKEISSCSGSEVEGHSNFFIEVLAELDRDGATELILSEERGETSVLVLYKIVGKRIKKVLEIGDYGL